MFSSHFHRWLKLPYLPVEARCDKVHLLFGPFSMDDKLLGTGINHLVGVCQTRSANKQFFGTGKAYAFSALQDELRHQQMNQISET